MEVVDEQLRTHILDAARAWAMARYGPRIRDEAIEHAQVVQTSSGSEVDYIVSLAILEGPAPLRVKVLVAPDGSLQISD